LVFLAYSYMVLSIKGAITNYRTFLNAHVFTALNLLPTDRHMSLEQFFDRNKIKSCRILFTSVVRIGYPIGSSTNIKTGMKRSPKSVHIV